VENWAAFACSIETFESRGTSSSIMLEWFYFALIYGVASATTMASGADSGAASGADSGAVSGGAGTCFALSMLAFLRGGVMIEPPCVEEVPGTAVDCFTNLGFSRTILEFMILRWSAISE
jgi:hypothetical protein